MTLIASLINTNSVTKEHLICPLNSGAFLFRPMVPVVGLVGGAFFSLVPSRGVLVRAVDFKGFSEAIRVTLASYQRSGIQGASMINLSLSTTLTLMINTLLSLCRE